MPILDFGQIAVLLLALAATGAVAGLISGLLGVGGGIVIVPVLFFVFGALDIDESVSMHVAVGTSLATIIFTGLVSARSHWKRGSVDAALLRSWGPWLALGVIIGTVVGGNVSGFVLTLIFATVAIIVSVNMALKSDVPSDRKMPGTPVRQGLAAIIGGVSVLMGIGGGTLSVPILSLFAYPIRLAVGTAAAIGLIIAIPGTLGYMFFGFGHPELPAFSLGYVNLAGLVAIVPLSMLTAPLGARIAHTISPRALRYCFAILLAATGIRMALSVF